MLFHSPISIVSAFAFCPSSRDSCACCMIGLILVRYKWDATLGADVRQIEAIELTQTFDPTATGFADLAGATPVMTVKSRLVLTR